MENPFAKLADVILAAAKEVKEHSFDANSENCKSCSMYDACSIYAGMINVISKSTLSEEVKVNIIEAIHFFRNEEDFLMAHKDDIIIETAASNLHKRFESLVTNFKYWKELKSVLDTKQLSYLRQVVLNIEAKIRASFDKILADNLEEANALHRELTIHEEERRYEDMTKEELIELLNKR